MAIGLSIAPSSEPNTLGIGRYEPYEEKMKRMDEAFPVAEVLIFSGVIAVGVTYFFLLIYY